MTNNKLGLVHIITGEGKGKTTAACGLALRALSHGLKVCYANFNKLKEKYGNTEVELLEKLGTVVITTTAEHPSFNRQISFDSHTEQTVAGLEKLNELIHREYFDMLIIDEILISVRDHFIEESTLIEFIKNRPAHTELVLTGRGATAQLIKIADYVSEIQNIKHPFDKGVYGREGIEY